MRHFLLCLLLCGVPLGVVACSDDAKKAAPAAAPPPPTRGAAAAAASASAAPSASASASARKVEYAESDFVESDKNRDPFRSYAQMFVVDTSRKPVERQIHVILAQYAVEELKIVAIVTGGEYPRAMLIDPTGKGWVVKKGDFLGRPEVLHTGGANGSDYQVNWRVERVRDGDLVLSREDPTQANAPPTTKIMPLHTEAERAKFELN